MKAYYYYSVGIATEYGLDGRGWFPPAEKDFFLHHSDQNDSGTHPASYPVTTKGSSPGSEANNSRPYSAEVKNGGTIPLLPHKSTYKTCYLIMH
jgi:hypothetical protein